MVISGVNSTKARLDIKSKDRPDFGIAISLAGTVVIFLNGELLWGVISVGAIFILGPIIEAVIGRDS